jgi:hypothetical protein
MHEALQRLLTDTIEHHAYLGQDSYGAPLYAPLVRRLCRLEAMVRRVVDAQGQERVSRSRCFFDGDVTLTLRDKLLLPDGTSPPILQLASVKDVDGSVDHWELVL